MSVILEYWFHDPFAILAATIAMIGGVGRPIFFLVKLRIALLFFIVGIVMLAPLGR